MGNRKYIRKSATGRFFLCESFSLKNDIDPGKRTKLWISSDYLFRESVNQNKEQTKKIISELIEWNEKNQLYENCVKLLKFQKLLSESGLVQDKYK